MYVSNSVFNVLISLDQMGVLKRDRENEAMQVFSLGNEYRIVLERKDKSLFVEDSETSYKCFLKFYNIIGIEVITLFGSEIDMSEFLDTIYFFLESNQTDALFGLYSLEGMCCIKFTKEYDSTMKALYNMSIMRYSQFNTLIPIATIKFDDESISAFIDLLYFTFLIDIDSIGTGEMSKIYRYIDHDMWIADNNSIPPKVSDLLNN